ncbi:hypothetical protein C8J34_1011224 [Rhizobium sp. PP-F2F-G36]|nr:hypothetical protein C8J34_1011224 [Rhizobium sp. PP-F2F-G36]
MFRLPELKVHGTVSIRFSNSPIKDQGGNFAGTYRD